MEANWHILTVTRGGTVSLLKNLTEDIARQTMQRLGGGRLLRDPWSDREIAAKISREANLVGGGAGGAFAYAYSQGDGDLVKLECFGPEGRDLVVWPKPADYDERYAAAVNSAKEVAGA